MKNLIFAFAFLLLPISIFAQTELDMKKGIKSLKNTFEMLEPYLEGKEFIDLKVTVDKKIYIILNIEQKSKFHYVFSDPPTRNQELYTSTEVLISDQKIVVNFYDSKLGYVDGIKRLISGPIEKSDNVVTLEHLTNLEVLIRSVIAEAALKNREFTTPGTTTVLQGKI